MIKILKETFSILNKNWWLLFIFMTICYIGLVYFSILQSSAKTLLQLLLGVVTLLFITIAGVAGLFYCLRNTVDAETSGKDFERMDLLKMFPKGVSDYFLPAAGVIIIYLIIVFLMFKGAMLIGKNLIGTFSFTPEELKNAMSSVEALNAFQNNISVDDLIKLSKWHLLYLAFSSVLTYLLIYWLPETFYNTKNSFLSLFFSIKKVLLNTLSTLQLFFTIVAINIITSLIMALMMPVPFLAFLVYFVYFYGFLYILLLTFNFYRHKFVALPPAETEKDDDTELEEE